MWCKSMYPLVEVKRTMRSAVLFFYGVGCRSFIEERRSRLEAEYVHEIEIEKISIYLIILFTKERNERMKLRKK